MVVLDSILIKLSLILVIRKKLLAIRCWSREFILIRYLEILD